MGWNETKMERTCTSESELGVRASYTQQFIRRAESSTEIPGPGQPSFFASRVAITRQVTGFPARRSLDLKPCQVSYRDTIHRLECVLLGALTRTISFRPPGTLRGYVIRAPKSRLTPSISEKLQARFAPNTVKNQKSNASAF